MKAVVDRIVQYANRYQLTNVETGEVLGTYDFVEVTGTVQQAGTEIDKELFDSIQSDLNTKADQDGTYTDLTAGKSNALTTAEMTAGDDLNNFYGEDYWGKTFYCGGGEEPSHSPSGASGGSVFIYRNGTGSTVQEYTSNVARSGSNLPTKWIRARAFSGTWNAWEEIVTSTGDYTDLSVGAATKATQDANGNVIDETYATKTEADAKYTKPASGIPETDLTDTAQESLDKADTAYQKPSTGIPKADLSEEVQNALETAVQGAPDATTTIKGIMTLGADGGAARYGEKSDVGLGNVDNTSDEDKPVSTAQAAAIADAKKAGTDAQSNVDKIINGTTAVGNAEKLNGKAASEYALSSDIPDVSNFAEKTGTYSDMSVGNATNSTNLIPDSNGAVNPGGRASSIVGANSTALGRDASASGDSSTAVGKSASASGGTSTALGSYASADDYYSIAVGYSASASGNRSTALGYDTSAGGDDSTALGAGASASGNRSTALGYDTSAGDNSTALGRDASASGGSSTALGQSASASGGTSTAVGYSASASGLGSTALGQSASASGDYSTALGAGASANGDSSTALGRAAIVSESDSSVIQLGGNTLSALRCQVNLTVTSDERDKADINNITNALPFIDKLNPVTFVSNDRTNYISDEDKKSENYRKYGMCDYDRVSHALGTKKGERRRCGLLAQEVVAAMQEVYGTDNYANIVNDNFHDLADKPTDVENKYTLAYANLVPFLIGAIKELNAEIKTLKDKLNDNN